MENHHLEVVSKLGIARSDKATLLARKGRPHGWGLQRRISVLEHNETSSNNMPISGRVVLNAITLQHGLSLHLCVWAIYS